MDDWTSEDVINAIMAGNDVAMNWWAMTHNQPLPADTSGGFVLSPSRVQLGLSTQAILTLALGGLALFLLLKR